MSMKRKAESEAIVQPRKKRKISKKQQKEDERKARESQEKMDWIEDRRSRGRDLECLSVAHGLVGLLGDPSLTADALVDVCVLPLNQLRKIVKKKSTGVTNPTVLLAAWKFNDWSSLEVCWDILDKRGDCFLHYVPSSKGMSNEEVKLQQKVIYRLDEGIATATAPMLAFCIQSRPSDVGHVKWVETSAQTIRESMDMAMRVLEALGDRTVATIMASTIVHRPFLRGISGEKRIPTEAPLPKLWSTKRRVLVGELLGVREASDPLLMTDLLGRCLGPEELTAASRYDCEILGNKPLRDQIDFKAPRRVFYNWCDVGGVRFGKGNWKKMQKLKKEV